MNKAHVDLRGQNALETEMFHDTGTALPVSVLH